VDWLDCLPVLHLVLLLKIWVLISNLVLLLLWSSSSFFVCYAVAAAAIYGAAFFCFCYGAVFFLSSPSSLHRSVLLFDGDFATSLFLEVKDNYPENLLDFYYVQVLFYFCALLYRCDVATYDLLKKWKKTN